MGYIEENLLPREQVFLQARVHPVIFLSAVGPFAMTMLFALLAIVSDGLDGMLWGRLAGLFFLFTLFALVRAAVLVMTTEFGITNLRIIAKRGFIRRHTLEMLVLQVESISVDQGFWGRLLNFGTVKIIGTGGTKERFPAIVDPLKVRRAIFRMIEVQSAARR